MSVFEIKGPFFFGAAETFRTRSIDLGEHPRVLIIRMRDVHALDSTGMHALRGRRAAEPAVGLEVLLSDVQPQPLAALEAAGVLDEIGAANVFPDIDDALARAYELDVTPTPIVRLR